MIFMTLAPLKKGPQISFKVKLTGLFFLVSLLVELGIIAVFTHQVQRANIEENYQYLEEESIISASTIGEVLWDNLEFLKLISSNSLVINQINQSNRQFPDDNNEIKQRLASLEKQWLASDQGNLVQQVIASESSQELTKASQVVTHYNQLFICNKHGALVSSIKYTDRFDFHQQSWWKFTVNQGKGNIYIGDIKLTQNEDKIVVPLAIPIYSESNPQEIIGIIYAEHNITDELNNIFNELKARKQEQGKESDLHLHRIYLDNNRYFDYENHSIYTDTELNIEAIEKQLEVGHKFDFRGNPSYIAGHKVTSLETDNIFARAIDNAGWYLVTIASRKQTHLLSLPFRILALLILGIVLLSISIIFTLYILNMITSPLKQMIEIAEDINNDRFESEDVNKLNQFASLDNDIGRLARVFQAMAQVVTNRTQSLQQQLEQMQQAQANHQFLQQEYTGNNQLKRRRRMSILKKAQALTSKMSADSSFLFSSTSDASVQTKSKGGISREMVSICQQQLAQYIGPMAEHIIQDAVEEDSQLTPLQLIDVLAQEIPDPEKAQNFRQDLRNSEIFQQSSSDGLN